MRKIYRVPHETRLATTMKNFLMITDIHGSEICRDGECAPRRLACGASGPFSRTTTGGYGTRQNRPRLWVPANLRPAAILNGI